MKSLRLSVLAMLAILWMAPRVQSQAILSIAGNEIIGMPDTVHFGDTLQNMSVWVRNDGNLPTPNLLITVNSLINGTVLGQVTGTLTLLGSLLPGDSVVIPLDAFVVSPQNSSNGANIVVVWPDSPGSNDGDTLQDTYYLEETATGTAAALAPQDHGITISIFPNPAHDVIFLRTENHFVGEVLVYDLNGRLLSRSAIESGSLDLRLLAPGNYILEMREKGGEVARKRFVKL